MRQQKIQLSFQIKVEVEKTIIDNEMLTNIRLLAKYTIKVLVLLCNLIDSFVNLQHRNNSRISRF